jgi:hypothetical protein
LVRSGYPIWESEPGFEKDVFTFVRLRFGSYGSDFRARWDGDYPDSDWNFSYRLHQLTALDVDPKGLILDIDDPALMDHAFACMISPGAVRLSQLEILALRQYLLNGGFMMVDDFFGGQQWAHLRQEFKRVFPKREPKELSLRYPIFNMVFKWDEPPQGPSIRAWIQDSTIEAWHGAMTDSNSHFMGYFDDEGRLMVVCCYNNDIGDGWERERENEDYFHIYSGKQLYPFGINLIMYALTY